MNAGRIPKGNHPQTELELVILLQKKLETVVQETAQELEPARELLPAQELETARELEPARELEQAHESWKGIHAWHKQRHQQPTDLV